MGGSLGEIQQPRLAVRRGKICRSANEFENIARSEGLVTEGDVERATEMLRAYLSTVEHGNIVPSLETIERFSAVLGVPIHELFLSVSAENGEQMHGKHEDPSFALLSGYVRNMNVADRQLLMSLAGHLSQRK